ncbi:MAG TPA: hypothetical protein VNZ22_11600, partial [Bacillota bacterium]|nr:hypothetical protein [Bacillota bacterium]
QGEKMRVVFAAIETLPPGAETLAFFLRFPSTMAQKTCQASKYFILLHAIASYCKPLPAIAHHCLPLPTIAWSVEAFSPFLKERKKPAV